MMELEDLKEGLTVELKSAESGVPKSLYETISSFSNTSGGDIYLGIKENEQKPNTLSGIANNKEYEKTILNTINNRNKISFPALDESSFSVIPLPNGRSVLRIHVDEATRTRKPVYLNGSFNESYKRQVDGDYRLTQEEIKAFLNDNGNEAFDSIPNARGYGMESVNLDTLHSYRREMMSFSPANVFSLLDDEAFLKANAFLQPSGDGRYVLSNAGVVLFTSSPLIETIFPFYCLDYIRRMNQEEKWDVRIATDDVTWSGNAFDFFLKASESLMLDIPSSYVSEKGRNIGPSLMQDMVKEALSNALSNHSFFLNGSLTIVRTNNGFTIKNNGKSLTPIPMMLSGGTSRPRNPAIISAFRRIGVADRAGTGIPRIINALSMNGFPQPVIVEENVPVNRMVLFVSLVPNGKPSGFDFNSVESKIRECLTTMEAGASVKEISEITGFSRSALSKAINDMYRKGMVSSNGRPTKGKRYFLNGGPSAIKL